MATALLSHWGLWFSWPRGLPEPEATAAAQVRSCGNGEGHSQLELPCGRFTATDRAADGFLSFKHQANESGTGGGGWCRAWGINIMSLGRSVRRVSAPGSGRGRLPCHRLVVERAAVSAAMRARQGAAERAWAALSRHCTPIRSRLSVPRKRQILSVVYNGRMAITGEASSIQAAKRVRRGRSDDSLPAGEACRTGANVESPETFV